MTIPSCVLAAPMCPGPVGGRGCSGFVPPTRFATHVGWAGYFYWAEVEPRPGEAVHGFLRSAGRSCPALYAASSSDSKNVTLDQAIRTCLEKLLMRHRELPSRKQDVSQQLHPGVRGREREAYDASEREPVTLRER